MYEFRSFSLTLNLLFHQGSYYTSILVVIRDSDRAGLLLNEVAVADSDWNNIQDSNPQLVAKYISVGDGVYRLRHQSPISTFGAFLYGYQDFESYAFPGGMLVSPINEVIHQTLS